MSYDWTDNRKNLMLFAGRSHPELAEQVAKELDVHVTAQTARDFANGEIFVRFDESVRGCDAFVLQSHPAPVNQWLMEQLIMIDALKRGSAKRITAVVPFYPYARQDKKHRGREPISARLVADLFKTAGADRIVTVDLHTDQIQGFFDGPVDHMRAQNLLTGYIKDNYAGGDMVVVSPDSGRVRIAEKWADAHGRRPAGLHSQDPRPAGAQPGGVQPGGRRGAGAHLRTDRRHDRHRWHHRRRGQAAARRRRQRRRHRRHPWRAVRPGIRAAGRSAAPGK